MYNMEIHKVLENGPKKTKTITSFERDHIKSKYIIRNDF